MFRIFVTITHAGNEALQKPHMDSEAILQIDNPAVTCRLASSCILIAIMQVNEGNAMKNKDRQFRFYFVLLLVSALPLFALGLSNHGVWTADEPRVAEVGREMALTGNWAVPTLNQKPFLEEPPLYYASIAATFRLLGGASDKTVRIPSAIFAFGGVLALFFFGVMLFGPRTGFLSAFIMATCGEYFRVAHWVIVDSALYVLRPPLAHLFRCGLSIPEPRQTISLLRPVLCVLYACLSIQRDLSASQYRPLPFSHSSFSRRTSGRSQDAPLARDRRLSCPHASLVSVPVAAGGSRIPESISRAQSSRQVRGRIDRSRKAFLLLSHAVSRRLSTVEPSSRACLLLELQKDGVPRRQVKKRGPLRKMLVHCRLHLSQPRIDKAGPLPHARIRPHITPDRELHRGFFEEDRFPEVRGVFCPSFRGHSPDGEPCHNTALLLCFKEVRPGIPPMETTATIWFALGGPALSLMA